MSRDIAFSAITLRKFCADPGRERWTYARRILIHPKGTSGCGIKYMEMGESDHLLGLGLGRKRWWSQTLLGKCMDTAGRTDIWGMEVTEIDSIVDHRIHGLWDFVKTIIQQMDRNKCVKKPSWIYCDNPRAIEPSKSDVFHKKSKRIDFAYHFTRDVIQQKKSSKATAW